MQGYPAKTGDKFTVSKGGKYSQMGLFLYSVKDKFTEKKYRMSQDKFTVSKGQIYSYHRTNLQNAVMGMQGTDLQRYAASHIVQEIYTGCIIQKGTKIQRGMFRKG